MRKIKYKNLQKTKRTYSRSRHIPEFSCILCKEPIKFNELYRYSMGREAHEDCVQKYIDEDGYISFDEKEKPIKRI